MHTTTQFPFEKVWCGVDIADIRPHKSQFSTYEGSPFELLPPIDAKDLDGSFSFLDNKLIKDLEKRYEEQHVDITFASVDTLDDSIWKKDPTNERKLRRIESELPIPLPQSFKKFMLALGAQELVPSCTACWFNLPNDVSTFKYLSEDGYIFHFYRDQQDCLFWYFYIRKNGENCILVSSLPIGVYEEEEFFNDQEVKENFFLTAYSFEEFIYRTWIENVLWYCPDIAQLEKTTAQHAQRYRELYGNNVQ